MGAPPTAGPVRYRIGDLILDTGSYRVTRNGETLKLGGLTIDLLICLVKSAPEFVTYDQLAEQVWQGRPVTPETIAQRAKMLRDAVSEDAKEPRYFELIRGRGYRLIADVEITPAGAARKPAKRAFQILGVAALAVAVLLFIGTSFLNKDTTPSVAVLPFADMTQIGDQQYLADGIAEELINELARLSGLHVASRTSSFNFRDQSKDLQAIADALGVATVLEGSVRKSQGDIRITVQLIDAASGYHMWSDTFDRNQDDIFAIQEEIASAVAGALGVTLGVGGVNEFRGAGTRNFAAYEAYLQRSYELATQLDPNYAAAWARLGVSTVSAKWNNPPEDAPEIAERAYPYVLRAIELDPESARAHSEFATLIYGRKEWLRAEEAFARSLALRRDRQNLNQYANMLMRTGRSRASQLVHSEADAVERIPRPASRLRNFVDIAQGNFDAARATAVQLRDKRRLEADVLIALNEGSLDDVRAALEAVPRTEIVKAELYVPLLDALDSPVRALATLEEVFADSKRIWPGKYHDIALLGAYFGDAEFALRVFSREMPYTTIRFGALWYPVMSEVRQLPGFKNVVTEANLVEYWRMHGWADYCRPLGDDDFVCQ